jgi:hypothetical protein
VVESAETRSGAQEEGTGRADWEQLHAGNHKGELSNEPAGHIGDKRPIFDVDKPVLEISEIIP